jgi:hypothetical protein
MKNNKDDLTVLNQIYKPNKYIIKGKVKILKCNNQDVVIKPKNSYNNNLVEIHKYLKSRDFNNFVPIIDYNRENYFVYPYIIEDKIPYEQKTNELAKTVAIMHAKTSYFKDVNESTFDEIYNNINNNIDYLTEYYSKMYDDIFLKRYYTPFENLFIDSYSKISNVLLFSKSELDIWYELASEKKTQRVSLVHNDLKNDHYLKGDEDYLISFDKSKIDTPVLDLYKFYKNEYDSVNFSEILKTYLYHFELNEDELKLFFILISIPDEFKYTLNNYNDVKNFYKIINYINITEELIRPYYSNYEKEE